MRCDIDTQHSHLAAILSDTYNMGARLAYASWLDALGDPLGQLIRVQVEIAGAQGKGLSETHPQLRELEEKESVLLKKLDLERPAMAERTRWRLGKPVFADWSFGIDRGVVTLSVHGLPPQTPIPKPPPAWFERFGWHILHVKSNAQDGTVFPIDDNSLGTLLTSPLLDRALGLNLSSLRLTDSQVRPLAETARTERLLTLNLCNNSIGAESATQIARSSHLGSLLDLNVSCNPIGDAGFSALADSSSYPSLQSLNLSGTRASFAGLSSLTRSGARKSLRYLEIVNVPLDMHSGHLLGNCARFPNLGILDLTECTIDDEVAEVIAAGKHLTSVQGLILDGNPITDAGAVAILRSPLFARTFVRLNRTQLGAGTIQALADTGRLDDGTLRLWNCGISDDALERLASLPQASSLETLSLGFSLITDRGACSLARSPFLKKLRRLNLTHSRIGPAGVEAITRTGSFPHLVELALEDNALGNAGSMSLARWYHERGDGVFRFHGIGLDATGLRALLDSGMLEGARELSFAPSPIGDTGVAALAESWDLCNLQVLVLWESGMTDIGVQALIKSAYLPSDLKILMTNNPGVSEGGWQTMLKRFPRSQGSVTTPRVDALRKILAAFLQS